MQETKVQNGIEFIKGYSIWKVRGGDVRVPKKIPRMGGLDTFPIARVGSLIFLAISMGGGMLGTLPTFYGVVKYHSTPTFLGVLPIIAPNSRFSWKWEYLYYTSSVSQSVSQSHFC